MLLGVTCCSVVSVVAEADVLSFLSRKTSYLQEMQSFSFESCFQEACQHAFFFFLIIHLSCFLHHQSAYQNLQLSYLYFLIPSIDFHRLFQWR